MDAEAAIPIAGLIVSACVAVGVPYLTFPHSRKLERVRLLGLERFRLYVDALTEAHAEMTWLEDRVYTTVYANEEMLPAPPDTRLPPEERARLGARMAAIAESPILLAWNRFDSLAMQYLLSTRTKADLPRFRMEMRRPRMPSRPRCEMPWPSSNGAPPAVDRGGCTLWAPNDQGTQT